MLVGMGVGACLIAALTGYRRWFDSATLLRANSWMRVTFWSRGMLNPWLARQGWHATRLIAWGVPLSLAVLAFNILDGASTGAAGWALPAYNLVIFAWVFFRAVESGAAD